MTKVAHWNDGSVGEVDLDDAGCGEKVKMRLLRAAVRMYEANQRQGTVKTKTRSEVHGTGAKPYRQKGTGRARRGDVKTPLTRGGGVIFGPRPRDYSYRMPRKALREALRSALLGKLADGEIKSLSSAGFDRPSTARAARVLAELDCAGTSVLLVVPSILESVVLSFRNIPRLEIVRAADVNAHQLLAHRHALFVDDAWDVLMTRLATLTRHGITHGGSES